MDLVYKGKLALVTAYLSKQPLISILFFLLLTSRKNNDK